MRHASDNPLLDRMARGLLFPYLGLMHRLRWYGTENVPRTGPAVLAANHQSYYDPVLISFAAHRRVTFLGWDFFCKMPVLGTFMRLVGTIPVDLDAPEPGAIARMIRTLDQGGLCGIFPEGGRSADGLIAEPKPGVATLALRSGAPVVPVTVHGAHRAWPRGRALPVPAPISIYFGPPLHVEPWSGRRDEAYQEHRRQITYDIMLRIADGFARLGRPDLTHACRRKLTALSGRR